MHRSISQMPGATFFTWMAVLSLTSPYSGDFDACWDPKGVSRSDLDPVFFQFANQRAAQKAKFGGEFFPSTTRADAQGRTFIHFFQVEKITRHPKGIVLIDLSSDPILQPQVTP